MRGINRNQGTEPAAAGLLAGLMVLLFAAVAIGCGNGCVPYSRLPGTVRTHLQQLDTVVKVESLCITDDPFTNGGVFKASGGTGSGVILDARHVLTAAHVVDCSYLPDVHVITASGKRMRAVVTRENDQTDLALLELASADTFGDIAPPVIGPRPIVGDSICKLQAVPTRGGDCGPVTDLTAEPGNDVQHGARVEHGNSGGPVYDAEGRLVGITTQMLLPDGAGGRFTSLIDRGQEMLP